MTLLSAQHTWEELANQDKVGDEIDLEELLALCVTCLQKLLVNLECINAVALTSSTVFPIPIPALLINTVASPCLWRISLHNSSTAGVSATSHL
jgi:hypothetical protein